MDSDHPSISVEPTVLIDLALMAAAPVIQHGLIPNKDRSPVDRHVPKHGVGWLMNDREEGLQFLE